MHALSIVAILSQKPHLAFGEKNRPKHTPVSLPNYIRRQLCFPYEEGSRKLASSKETFALLQLVELRSRDSQFKLCLHPFQLTSREKHKNTLPQILVFYMHILGR